MQSYNPLLKPSKPQDILHVQTLSRSSLDQALRANADVRKFLPLKRWVGRRLNVVRRKWMQDDASISCSLSSDNVGPRPCQWSWPWEKESSATFSSFTWSSVPVASSAPLVPWMLPLHLLQNQSSLLFFSIVFCVFVSGVVSNQNPILLFIWMIYTRPRITFGREWGHCRWLWLHRPIQRCEILRMSSCLGHTLVTSWHRGIAHHQVAKFSPGTYGDDTSSVHRYLRLAGMLSLGERSGSWRRSSNLHWAEACSTKEAAAVAPDGHFFVWWGHRLFSAFRITLWVIFGLYYIIYTHNTCQYIVYT